MYTVAHRHFLLKQIQLQTLDWPFCENVTLLISNTLNDVSLMDVIEHACKHVNQCRLVLQKNLFGDGVPWHTVTAPLFCPKRNGQCLAVRVPGRALWVPRGLFHWDYGEGLPKPKWMMRRGRGVEDFDTVLYTENQWQRKHQRMMLKYWYIPYIIIIGSIFIAFVICML